MSSRNDKRSFWTTLPGILTEIIGLITAIIVLYYTLYVPPTPPDTQKPTLTPTPSVIPSPLPVTVQGIVTDENNMVVSDVKVSIDGQSSMTGNDGRYVISGVPTGIKTIRVEQREEVIFKSTITIEGGKEIKTFDILLPFPPPTITETPEPTPTLIPTKIPTLTPTLKPTDGIELPPIDWGIMETYFDISDVTIGKAEYTDVLGMVYEYDSINFIVEAKRSFYAIIIFKAEFYDEAGIKIYSSFVEFDPDYDQWEAGDRSRGHVELPGTSDMEKVRHIKISQFI